jgi:hypothetical protein
MRAHLTSCGGSNGADQVFSFTTSRKLNFRASTAGHSLYLRSADCQSGAELACGYWPGIDVVGLEPGTYYPVCEEPIPLVFMGGGSAARRPRRAPRGTPPVRSLRRRVRVEAVGAARWSMPSPPPSR